MGQKLAVVVILVGALAACRGAAPLADGAKVSSTNVEAAATDHTPRASVVTHPLDHRRPTQNDELGQGQATRNRSARTVRCFHGERSVTRRCDIRTGDSRRHKWNFG